MSKLAPIPTDFTSIVASREFEIIQSGVLNKLIVQVGMPIQDVETVDGYDWRCPVRIIDGDTIRERRACGVDSFQALHLAMQLIQDEVNQIAAEEGSHVNLFS
ncbi:hypothetical protein FNW02_35010 [Komarekiella sp. 'clone 1']|uniref:DUF6968 domain-containing protein n=1 Tax=Komarekiella delphini-convector SJRDD-AB1 TaxID=2593771 RepID=A0AA40T534_9NOST|nr:hypothetical protein [Komarekiella delphini-convector]MBD6620825.1 hypothetical protein [Komarekiella delphini-convector SJRDD-AB1]